MINTEVYGGVPTNDWCPNGVVPLTYTHLNLGALGYAKVGPCGPVETSYRLGEVGRYWGRMLPL